MLGSIFLSRGSWSGNTKSGVGPLLPASGHSDHSSPLTTVTSTITTAASITFTVSPALFEAVRRQMAFPVGGRCPVCCALARTMRTIRLCTPGHTARKVTHRKGSRTLSVCLSDKCLWRRLARSCKWLPLAPCPGPVEARGQRQVRESPGLWSGSGGRRHTESNPSPPAGRNILD